MGRQISPRDDNLMKRKTRTIKVIDLFCGIGGLTHGLKIAGLDVVVGIDNDATCRYGYETSNDSPFLNKDILDVRPSELKRLFGDDKNAIRVLVGCAPCQPFSRLNPRRVTKKQLQPLEKFAQLVDKAKPDIVSMENVSGLADTTKYPIFQSFLDTLERNHYKYKYEVVDVAEYGVPQTRARLVLLASRMGRIKLVRRTHKNKPLTVRKAIGKLPPINDGETSATDSLHKARKLDPINKKRIRATVHDGGNSADWPDELKLKCHRKKSGKTYRHTVYGRMRWNQPAPTMTTQCIGLGNGRFGHPEQDRAISLREAAIFQTFPSDYVFTDPTEPMHVGQVAKFIGNAVPVRLGTIIGRSIKRHVKAYAAHK
jgi:DNA (cytosine-5)-methyltransferase 1